jgi:hypothetical protein
LRGKARRGEANLGSIQVLARALILSVLHALMPDHWIPLVTVSKDMTELRVHAYQRNFAMFRFVVMAETKKEVEK